MRKGAQYKVYSTLFNILGPIPLIRHTRDTCRSRFSESSMQRRCKSRDLPSNRVLQGGHAVTSSLLIRAERSEYARIKPPSMHVPCVQPACGELKVGPRAAASSASAAVQESRSSGASAHMLTLPTPTASSPLMVCIEPKCCRRCRPRRRLSSRSYLCVPTCRMLESYAVVSMAASSEVMRLALA